MKKDNGGDSEAEDGAKGGKMVKSNRRNREMEKKKDPKIQRIINQRP